MVSLKTVQQSNALVATLPQAQGLIALFIGATSGIGQGTLKTFAQNTSSPRIYTVARPSAVTSHENLLASLRQSTTGTYNLITADISLISEVDKIVNIILQKETKLDILFMSAGFMAFEGRKETREGLDPSMTTRYYSRLYALQKLLPLLNNASAPRVVWVLAGGMEGPLNERDLDLRDPNNWSFWNASVHAATMSTLALELLASENPRLSILHWFPGAVTTPGLARAQKFGMSPPNPASEEDAGRLGLFLATSDRYSVQGGAGGLVPMPEGLNPVKNSGGGILLVDPQGESADNEGLLAGLRKRGVNKAVWSFTQKMFAEKVSAVQSVSSKDEL